MASEFYIIEIELIGIGVLSGKIERIFSPLTIQRFIRKIPISGLGRFFIGGRDYFMIPIGVKKELEKPTDTVNKGDIVYETGSDSMMVCLTDGKTRMEVSRMGTVEKGLELFDKIQRSNTVKITLLK